MEHRVTANNAVPQTEYTGDLPPKPKVVTQDTVCEWITQVAPLLDERSKYRKRLLGIVQRHEFRKTRNQ
jgi:hypothetical protein